MMLQTALSQNTDPAYLAIMLVMLAGLVTLATVQSYMLRRRKPRIERVVTVIECCGQRIERKFKPGDYIGKTVDCEDCSQPGRIVAIYLEKVEKK